MDRLIAPNSVDADHADTAPVTGTPGFATDGNPATGVPATLWPSYQYNAIQEELIAIIDAGSLTPSKETNTQVRDAVLALFAKINGDATQTFSVAPATASNHAVQLGQLAGVIGSSSNLVLTMTSGTAFTLTADQIIVGSALNGLIYAINGVSHTFNAATTGLNGMDTGSLPTTGAVAVYEVYNPTSGAKGLLGQALASIATVAPTIYGGANPVSGYTASALVAVLRTSSSALIATKVLGRRHLVSIGLVATTTTAAASPTPLTLTIVPGNAKSMSGYMIAGVNIANTEITYSLAADSSSLGAIEIAGTNNSVSGQIIAPGTVDIFTPATLYYTLSVAAGTGNVGFSCTGYTI